MICAQCKDEKWDRDICPTCGLSEKEALLKRAEDFRLTGKNLLAADFYQKYLQLEPDRIEVLREIGRCLCLESISQHDNLLFEKAARAMTRALEKDWNWKQGHQIRSDLFISFGKLEALFKEYEEIGQKDDMRRKVCEDMVKILRLTKKFKENPPAVTTTLITNWEILSLIKSFWFLLIGLPVLLWATYEVSTVSNVKDEKQTFVALFVFLILGLAILVLFLLGMNSYRKKNKKGKTGKDD